jgi:holliday junction DNA helicase RuvA
MYSYLRGVYKGHAPDNFEAILVEVAGIGYEMIVPPIVEQELSASYHEDDPILVWVSTQSGRDQPWPVLFGFLSAREKAFWELLVSVPRVGGKLAARSMVVPIDSFAAAIQDGNRAFLDGLPGVTLDGADKIIASLRKKVGPFVQPISRTSIPRVRRSEADEMRDDAITLLMQMGLKRLEAHREVTRLLASRDDITSVQDIITAHFKAQRAGVDHPLVD